MNTSDILTGDAQTCLAALDARSVQCVVTSPPYFGLRDYGVDGQIGLEPTPDAYVQQLVGVFREVRRVLKDDGTVWLNLGDSYAAGKAGRTDYGTGDPTSTLGPSRNGLPGNTRPGPVILRSAPEGLKPKDLVGIPWRVAFALQADGWYLRSDVIWHKPNPMPESVTDRPTKAHEYLFLLTKNAKYYYDAAAIKEPVTADMARRAEAGHTRGQGKVDASRNDATTVRPALIEGADRNKRSVWTITPQPFKGAHFATMPEKLVEPCILAGSAPGDVVLDPFAGSGTVGVVALHHGRDFIGIELNSTYVQLAEERIAAGSRKL